MHGNKLDFDMLRTQLDSFASIVAGTDQNKYKEEFKAYNTAAREVLGVIPQKNWKGMEPNEPNAVLNFIGIGPDAKDLVQPKTQAEFISEHGIVTTKAPKTHNPAQSLESQGYEFGYSEKKVSVINSAKTGKRQPPMEINFDENKKDGNIMWATYPDQQWLSTKLATDKVTRQDNGSYEEVMGHDLPRLGITQLDIIHEMQDKLDEEFSGDKKATALVVRGKGTTSLKKLNYMEAKEYLTSLEKLHKSPEYAFKEMKERIDFSNRNNGDIAQYDNAQLEGFASANGYVLKYNIDSKAHAKIEELVKKVQAATHMSEYDAHNMSLDKLVDAAQKNNVKFNYQDIKGHDQIEIQSSAGQSLGTVKGLTIRTKDATMRD